MAYCTVVPPYIDKNARIFLVRLNIVEQFHDHEDSHSVCSFSFTDQIYQISDKGGNHRPMRISPITPGPPVLISLSIRARAGQIGVTQVQKDGLNLKLIRMVWTGSSEGLSEPEAQKDGLDRKFRRMVWTGSSEGWC